LRFIPGVRRLDQRKYSDLRDHNRTDPERQRQPELDWYMERYDSWRSMFDGRALEETISAIEDLQSDSDQENFRWPVRFNLIKSYCLLYAGLLWGRAKTGAEADNLFDIRIDPKVPGKPGPEATNQAQLFKEALDYWWSYHFHALRPLGTIQQWAGGCALKIAWDPYSSSSVFGCTLQTIQPEHFYPIWNPLNYEELIAVKVKFDVSKSVAMEVYGLTEEEVTDIIDRDKISVEEHWDRYRYYVRLGKGRKNQDDPGIAARIRDAAGRIRYTLDGANPFIHPVTQRGIIPFVYIPRIRIGGFFGSSLAYDLEGIQNEVNKTLADFGDALTRGSHPAFGISDYHGPGDKQGVIMVPRHGALNMGKTPPGREPPKVHEFPPPEVPTQTPSFMESLLSLSEVTTSLTAAAQGAAQGADRSGFAMTMQMLPTTNMVDWERSHWTAAIAGKGGVNEILGVIWNNKAPALASLPRVDAGALQLRQKIEYRPVVPRDRLAIVDEVVKLATAKVVSPRELLKRLGDIEDIDEELERLGAFLVKYAAIEAAVAGRAVKIHENTNPENPAGFMPEVSGETVEPKSKQPAKQTQGQKANGTT
jgi:hypothetical protein